MPNVDDQVDPGLVAVMPSLMVERVVENDALALLEVPPLVADPHRSTLGT